MKPKKVYMRFQSKFMQRLVSYMPVTVAMHWTMQGMLYADPTERRFKLFLDALLTTTGGFVLSKHLPKQVAWPSAFLLAHTLNFFSNAQLCALSTNYILNKRTRAEFEQYVEQLIRRVEQEPSVRYMAICGSREREAWKLGSDLDARLIRHPGFINGIRAAWFLLRERSRALIYWFPLDMYLFDSESSLKSKLGINENITRVPTQKS